jgi:hypothetical protein
LTSSLYLFRRLTIEEVSIIFDTGRLGDAKAATAEFQQGSKLSDKEAILPSTSEKYESSHVEVAKTVG